MHLTCKNSASAIVKGSPLNIQPRLE